MTHDPRTREEVYESLKSSLTGKITKLTNFTERSFNYVWTQAFAEEIRELELLALTSELAGFIDFTGGPVTQEQLDAIGIGDRVTPEEINERMDDSYLDEYVKIVGVTRLPGSRASGSVTFTTQAGSTTIPEGTIVSTEPESDGSTIDFETTEEATTSDGVTTVTDVGIQAVDVGERFNVAANTIVRLADPPIGVKGVINPESTTGGEPEETNDELRERAKQQVEGASEGGTTEGIKAYLRNNIEGVREGDVIIEEFLEGGDGPGGQESFVDVIVDGGTDQDVLDGINFSRPTGIRHELIRPQVFQLGARGDLTGTDINTELIEETVEAALLNLGIGENGYKDQFVQLVMNRDENIENIELFDSTYDRVTNERFQYDNTQTDYRIDLTYENVNGSITIIDGSGDSYTEGTDFNMVDQSGDGWPETIVWDTNEATPDDGEDFFADYDVTTPATLFEDRYSVDLVRDESNFFDLGHTETLTYDTAFDPFYRLSDLPFEGTTSITDGSGDTYTEGIDYDLRSIGYGEGADKFTFSDTTDRYYLVSNVDEEEVSIEDENGVGYVQGTDYRLQDTSLNGRQDTVIWDLDGNEPADGVDFTVTYLKDNGLRQHIDWSQTFFAGAVADDGGTTTEETTEARTILPDDVTLLPSSPATGDAYYFGGQETYDDVELEISTPGEGTWDVVWEYYNGTSWVALSNVTDNTNDFREDGVNKVTFDIPGDWSTTDVGGVTGLYWVRGRLDTFTSITTQPLGQLARRDASSRNPDDNEDFTVTYDIKGYTTKYEVVETPGGEIRDASGDVYEQDVEYEIIDYDEDDENEIIHWLTNPATLSDGEEFFTTYLTEGDIIVDSREKIDPSGRTRVKVSNE
jgi:hypothetical protein